MKQKELEIEKLGECKIDSPLENVHFEQNGAKIVFEKEYNKIMEAQKAGKDVLALEKAGPREKIYFDPAWTRAAIVTAGGLCPGLNDVIKGLTLTLRKRYGVKHVYGIKYGYQGMIPKYKHEPLILTEEVVDSIHDKGGTILASSRGWQDEKLMLDTLDRMNVNVLFCIGGDGTLRCAGDIAKEAKKRNMPIAVVGIPKTIDNDISFIDKTFGFETAVYATNPVITAAHNEAEGAPNGVSLVHVMGRDSGFIAAYAALANSHVNYCLIPEEKFSLYDGENALIPNLKARLKAKGHAVIIIAEGAGQELLEHDNDVKDKSGNVIKQNIGRYLKDKIIEAGKKDGFEVNMKYFDPSYSIRSVPAVGTDAVFCLMLAQNAVHAAMCGKTNVVSGHWNDAFTNVPISAATSERKQIDLKSGLWRSVKSVTWPKYN